MSSKEFDLKGVNHAVYLVSNLERSLKFYRDYLVIKQIPKMVPQDHLVWLLLPSGVMIHLIENKELPLPSQRTHIAFEVDDIDKVTEKLKEDKIEILTSGVRLDGQRYLFIYDPDQNRVEFCTVSNFNM